MAQDIKFDLFEIDEIHGPNRLKIFDKIKTVSASPTDYAIACGAAVHWYAGEGLENKKGYYWTKTDNERHNGIFIIYPDGHYDYQLTNEPSLDTCIRPVLPFSKIRDNIDYLTTGPDGEITFQYGLLPQQTLSEQLESDVYDKLESGWLEELNMADCAMLNNIEQKTYKDKENNQLYQLVKANPFEDEVTLSNGRVCKRGDNIIIGYSPIDWILTLELDRAFARKLIAPARFSHGPERYNGNFEESNLYQDMNTYLINTMFDIPPSRISSQIEKEQPKILKK